MVDILLGSMAAYLILGLLFSLYFYLKAGPTIDEGMKGTPWHFKLMIFPGVVLFWIVLLKKALRKS
jgi:hypothetical protein